MSHRYRKSTLSNSLIYFLAALTTSSSAYAVDLFRWQDDQGNIHYTDQVPPKYIEQGYRVISEQGLTIRTIKSTAEIESNQVPSTPQISKKQAYQDQRLLMTYSSEEEITSTRDRKLADTQAMLDLTQETIILLDTQFRQLTKEASDFEKQNKEIPESLLGEIYAARKKIKNYQNRLDQGSDSITKIKQSFATTLQRYRQLKNAMDNIEQKP